MRRLLAFLVLAGGGLLALAAATGGFYGNSRERAKPELDFSDADPTGASRPSSGVPMTELPIGRGQLPPASVEPLESLDVHENPPRTWIDPVTKEKIELPYYPELSVHFTDPAPYTDAASGDVGARWRKAEVLMYRDVTSLTREEALALRATMVAAGDGRTPRASSEEDAATRRRFVRFVITAEDGEATLRTIPFVERGRAPEVRKVVRLTKNVRIHDLLQNSVLHATDLVIDHTAGTAEGTGPIEVESPAYRMRGRGFRLDRKAARLVILEQTVVDAREVASDVSGGPVDFASGAFRPRLLRAGGTVTVRRLADEHGEPWHEVLLTGGVHVELDGNRTLDAKDASLHIVRATLPSGAVAPRRAPGPPAVETGDRWRLARMTADGQVLVESPDAAAAPSALLSAWGPRMVSDFAPAGQGTTRLEGRCGVSWRGRLALPGEATAFHVVTATCEEVLRFGPRDAAETSLPSCDAVLDLLGSAQVDVGAGGADPDPQRIEADRLRVCLRKKVPASRHLGTTDPARGRPDAMGTGMVAIAFSATGEARLSGPRVRGRAREIHGFDLDRDDFRVVATGQGSLLEIVEKAASVRSGAASGGTPTAGVTRTGQTWILDRMSAVGGVSGSSAAVGGVDPLRFTGERFDFAGTTGGILKGRDDARASVVLPGGNGRDDVLEALVISFGGTEAERTLHAEGGARLDLAMGGRSSDAARAAAPSGTRIVALRSGSRIEAVGSRDAGDARDAQVTVTLSDGGSLEARTGETTTDRIAGERIELVLVERVPAPGETTFGAFGGRARDASPPASGAGTARASSPTRAGPQPAPRGLGDGRWTLRADRMDVVAASSGRDLEAVKHLVAEGGVDVRSQGARSAARFEGGRLELEGPSGHGVLTGRTGERAKVTLGEDPAPQRLASPRIDFQVVGGDLAQATFAAPVSGIVHGTPGKDGRTDRYGIVSEAGPLTIERGAPGAGSTIVLVGTQATPVLVGRTTRDAKGAPLGRPVRLSTPRLTLTTSKPLGVTGMELERLTAEGPGTRVDVGEDAPDATHAVGDLLVYDRAASRMTLSAKDRVAVVSPDMNGRVRRFMLDPATGLWDVEGAERIRAEVPR